MRGRRSFCKLLYVFILSSYYIVWGNGKKSITIDAISKKKSPYNPKVLLIFDLQKPAPGSLNVSLQFTHHKFVFYRPATTVKVPTLYNVFQRQEKFVLYKTFHLHDTMWINYAFMNSAACFHALPVANFFAFSVQMFAQLKMTLAKLTLHKVNGINQFSQ